MYFLFFRNERRQELVLVKNKTLFTLYCQYDERWSWWRHQMEAFSALLAICAGNSPIPGEFPAQRPVTRSFDVFFDLRLNKRLSKQSWGWWFETLLRLLWRHWMYPGDVRSLGISSHDIDLVLLEVGLGYFAFHANSLHTDVSLSLICL